MTDRRNINRGYKKLEVWQGAIELYMLAVAVLSKLPYIHQRSAANAIDAAQSISRNIAEGYGRKGLKEYLTFLNYSLGSCGEFHSAYFAFKEAKIISSDTFERLDTLHYEVENKLIKLIESLQRKLKNGDWDDSFAEG